MERLQALGQQQAYFFSRLKVSTQVYGPDGQRWTDVARQLDHQGPQVDLPVTLGAVQQLPVRLLAVRVPQEVADQRRRKLRDEARDKGRQVSARRLALAACRRAVGWSAASNSPTPFNCSSRSRKMA